MYKVEHTGERTMQNGRVEKVGPRAVQGINGYVTIKPGETLDMDLSDDIARMVIGQDGGPLKFHLTDEQAKVLNTPVKREPKPAKVSYGIPENWKELDWNARRALAVTLANGVKVTSGEIADKIISEAVQNRRKNFRADRRRERNRPDDIRSANRS